MVPGNLAHATSVRLDDLGDRICIVGPSNSGKSTLAAAIAAARGLSPVHLDRLRHLPGTDWIERSDGDFATLHHAAIHGERWVIDGNYSTHLPARLARATGVIQLDLPIVVALARYVRRCLFARDRIGGLEGGPDRVKGEMLHHIVISTPRLRQRYAAMTATLALPVIRLASSAALTRFYRDERLCRP